MARILVQTNDHLTVLEEREVGVAVIRDDKSAGSLLTRLELAIQEADSARVQRKRTPRRVAVIVGASDYRDVCG